MQDLTDANIKVSLLHFDFIEGTFSGEYRVPAVVVFAPQLPTKKYYSSGAWP